jgi:hypothetical protein
MWRIEMLNCKQATALMSQGMDRKLGIFLRANLRFHLIMCDGCRNFEKQVQFLREGLRKFPQQHS